MITGNGWKVIDSHVHFPSRWPRGGERHPLIERYNEYTWEKMHRTWDFGEPEEGASTPEEELELADRWAAEVERYQLERVVFITGSSNDGLHRVVRRHPDKFLALCFHNPAQDGAAAELRRAHQELGVRGYKMLAPRIDLDFTDPKLEPVWTYLADHKLYVLIHFGVLGRGGGIAYHKNINPLTLFPVARAYPDIAFVIPHFGCGYPRELLQLGWSCPNVLVDTSGTNEWMRWMPYPLTLEDLFRKFYETFGPERIVFGTDSSWFPRGFAYRYLQDQMRACRWLAFKEEDIRAIFRDNAARLLKLDQAVDTVPRAPAAGGAPTGPGAPSVAGSGGYPGSGGGSGGGGGR